MCLSQTFDLTPNLLCLHLSSAFARFLLRYTLLRVDVRPALSYLHGYSISRVVAWTSMQRDANVQRIRSTPLKRKKCEATFELQRLSRLPRSTYTCSSPINQRALFRNWMKHRIQFRDRRCSIQWTTEWKKAIRNRMAPFVQLTERTTFLFRRYKYPSGSIEKQMWGSSTQYGQGSTDTRRNCDQVDSESFRNWYYHALIWLPQWLSPRHPMF